MDNLYDNPRRPNNGYLQTRYLNPEGGTFYRVSGGTVHFDLSKPGETVTAVTGLVLRTTRYNAHSKLLGKRAVLRRKSVTIQQM